MFCLGASHPSAAGSWDVSEHPPGCILFRCNSSALSCRRGFTSPSNLSLLTFVVPPTLGDRVPCGSWVLLLKDRVSALHRALEKHLPGISWRNPLAPALPPSCAAFLAVPTPSLCNCLWGRRGVTPGGCFDPLVSPLLSNAVWKDLFESFFSRRGRPCTLAHARGAAALGFKGKWKPGLWREAWLGTQSFHSALLLHLKRPVCAQRSDGCPSDIPACRDPVTATPPAALCLPCLVCWRLLEHLHMLNNHCVTPWQRVLFYPLLRGVNWDREHPLACLWPHKKFSGGPAIRTLRSRLCCVLMTWWAFPPGTQPSPPVWCSDLPG